MNNFTLPLLGIAFACVSSCSEQTVQAQQTTPARAQLVAPAELVSLQDATIGPPNIQRMWQFKIEYLAPENSLVKTGDLVVRFDGQQVRDELLDRRSQLDAAIKQAEKKRLDDDAKQQDLALEVAEAKMNQEIAQRKVEITDVSRSEIERQKQAAEFKIASLRHQQAQQKLQQHIEHMKVNEQVQNAKIKNLQVRVNTLEQSLEKLSILAPKDGMVVYQTDWEDTKPAVGETVYMGRTLMSLPSLDKIAVKVEFDESDTAKVAVGQRVKVVLDAYPEKPFSGTISSLGQAYRNRSSNNLKVVFDAWVELDNLDMDIMRPGMKANVQLVQGGQQG